MGSRKETTSDSGQQPLAVESLRVFVRGVIRESMENAYNDYQASQDVIMKRFSESTEDEVKMRFPKFVDAIANGFHGIDDHEGLHDTRWFFMKTTYDTVVPFAFLPHGDDQIVYWDENTDKLKVSKSYDLARALSSFADRTSTY